MSLKSGGHGCTTCREYGRAVINTSSGGEMMGVVIGNKGTSGAGVEYSKTVVASKAIVGNGRWGTATE